MAAVHLLEAALGADNGSLVAGQENESHSHGVTDVIGERLTGGILHFPTGLRSNRCFVWTILTFLYTVGAELRRNLIANPTDQQDGPMGSLPADAMTGHSLRVLVVEDNESVRRAICQLVQSEADIEVACEAVDGDDAIRKAREHLPDVVLLDLTMPNMNGLEAAHVLKREFPAMHIVIVSQHDSRGFQWAALGAGASGYVVKSNAAKDLIPELRKIQGKRLPA